MPGGVLVWGTGHQLQSVLSPPKRITGWAPGARFRTNCTNAGFKAFGSVPANDGIAHSSVESPTKPLGITRPAAPVVNTAGPPGSADDDEPHDASNAAAQTTANTRDAASGRLTGDRSTAPTIRNDSGLDRAAVDHERLPVDRFGRRRSEEHDRVGDLFGLEQPSESPLPD